MFTGIIERSASVVSVVKSVGKSTTIRLDLGTSARGMKVGGSIAINGVCLTITQKKRTIVTCDVIEETLHLTNLGSLAKGSRVNIERGLRLADRIDGHLVTGHIDGTGRIVRITRLADRSVQVWIQASPELLSMMAPKGSVAVDGISLTLVDVTQDSFSVCLIPRTLAETTMGRKKKGDSVNIEIDLVAKYLRRFTQQKTPADTSMQAAKSSIV